MSTQGKVHVKSLTKQEENVYTQCRRWFGNIGEISENKKWDVQKKRQEGMTSGIIEIDVHGLRVEEAVAKVAGLVQKAGTSTYRIRVIHGYHGGTRIRNGIQDEFSYGREPKVKRIVMGNNPGITELVLREF